MMKTPITNHRLNDIKHDRSEEVRIMNITNT